MTFAAPAGNSMDVVRIVQDVVGDNLIGAYLHGSAVLGGLRPRSDLDVLCVVSEPTHQHERAMLVRRIMAISGSRAALGPARPVELTIVVGSDVRPWRYPPRCDFQYGEWLRDEYEQGTVPSPFDDPGLALLVTMTLLGNRPLVGPQPAALLDPVPRQDLDRALVSDVPRLLSEAATDTTNVLLTLARIWLTLATGDIASKDVAATWVLDRLPSERRAALIRARAVYLGHEHDSWDDLQPEVRRLGEELVRAIDRIADR
ncbi:MAG TPA: aminoglycoside adenylyltransferase family protein [Jatrophihabitans sp.]|jgi:streptomycin 3"-adenylyltransferase|uniref:aminoglycoside adenylyltransferase family protein n=1 Tax=Jatrophihabitans sp. TaxID=1932789 RepID=UPI002EED01B4